MMNCKRRSDFSRECLSNSEVIFISGTSLVVVLKIIFLVVVLSVVLVGSTGRTTGTIMSSELSPLNSSFLIPSPLKSSPEDSAKSESFLRDFLGCFDKAADKSLITSFELLELENTDKLPSSSVTVMGRLMLLNLFSNKSDNFSLSEESCSRLQVTIVSARAINKFMFSWSLIRKKWRVNSAHSS